MEGLRTSIQSPYLGSPSDFQRDVKWELDNVVLARLRIIRKVLGSPAVSSNALVDIQLSFVDALCSIQKFVQEMDWIAPERDLDEENQYVGYVLEEIEQIHGNDNTCDLINPPRSKL